MEYTHCNFCTYHIPNSELVIKEVDGATVISCPDCLTILAVKVEQTQMDYSEFLPNVDEINYTIHCLHKQATKLSSGLVQLYSTITKFEILRELAKEKELN